MEENKKRASLLAFFNNVAQQQAKGMKGLVFLRVCVPMEESETGKYALKVLHPGSHVDRKVNSLGIVFDNEYNSHRIVYEHHHTMENDYDYHTVLGRELVTLSTSELEDLKKAVSETLVTDNVYPAYIVEFDEEDEEQSLYAVGFDKAFDEQQQDIGDRYDTHTIDQELNVYYFSDYDNAIMFAYENSWNLQQRGQVQPYVRDDGLIDYNVVLESSNHFLGGIAAIHHGYAEYSREGIGTPLVTGVFSNEQDASAFKNDVLHLADRAAQSIVDRTTDASAKAFTAEQQAYLEAYLHQNDDSLEDVTRKSHLFSVAEKNDAYHSASKMWKDSTFEEVTTLFANSSDSESSLKQIEEKLSHQSSEGLKR